MNVRSEEQYTHEWTVTVSDFTFKLCECTLGKLMTELEMSWPMASPLVICTHNSESMSALWILLVVRSR